MCGRLCERGRYDIVSILFLGVQNELLLERQHLSRLQADFNYNLSLLSQRDEELAHYEKAFTELKRVVNNLLAENSEL